MSEEEKNPLSGLDGLGFIDQIIDGLRTVGESLQLQDLLDDVFYMVSKYGVEFLVNSSAKLEINTPVPLDKITTANRGVMFVSLSSNPVDVGLMTQVAQKKMAFILSRDQVEKPFLKSVFKGLGYIATFDQLLTGENDGEIFEWIRANRKVLCVVIDDTMDPSYIETVMKKVLVISRDGFCPIIPVGISGSDDVKPGAEIKINLGEKIGVNQKISDDDLSAMGKDLLDQLKRLRQQ